MKIIVAFMIFVSISCSITKNQKGDNELIVKSEGKMVTKPPLPSIYYLSNRISDCESRIEFMKSVIVPDDENTKLYKYEDGKYSRFGHIQFKIRGENNASKLKDLHLFYIDLDCLCSLDYSTLFKILCTKEDYETIIKDIEAENNSSKKYIFDIVINNFKSGGFLVNNKEVIGCSWNIGINSSY